jgi:Male sterility protein
VSADVLLAGTGGVGRDVLVALLRRTSARVALLMPDRLYRPSLPRANALFERLALDAGERSRIEVLAGDLALPNLGLSADVRGRLADSLETIVHAAGTVPAGHDGTAHALLFAERCFMSGRLRRFIHVNGATEDRMVRAAMNAGLPVTIVGPDADIPACVVNTVVRVVDARCA